MQVSVCLFTLLLPPDLALTASLTYFLMGLTYEYTHFIVHTKYNPTTAYARSVRRNHMLHHLRNEGS